MLSFIYDIMSIEGTWVWWHDAVKWGFLDILAMAVDF